MPFTRPALGDIVTRVEQDFVSRLELVGPVLRRAVVRVFARVIAGASHMLNGFIAWGIRQLFPDTCELPFLLRWGAIFGVPQNPAVAATGTATATGTNGSVIPSGTALARSDGTTYTTTADATIASGTATVLLAADVPAADGDCDPGTILSLVEPITGVASTLAVVAMSGGDDLEDTEAYRARVLQRIQLPPQGGADSDYEEWAKQVPGVTRIWPIANGLGLGSVLVYFMRDDDSGSPIPDSGEVAAVQAHLNSLRPTTAAVTVAAPTGDTTNFTIHLNPSSSELQTAVGSALADLVRRESAPSTPAVPAVLPISHIRTAIGNAVGAGDYTLSAPTADITPAAGHIPIMGTVTYV